MNEKPYKMYKGGKDSAVYIVKDGQFIYYKYTPENTIWRPYDYTTKTPMDVFENAGIIVFVRDMSEEELFLELL